MASIITPLSPPVGAPNVVASIEPGPGMNIGAGTTYYGNGAFLNLFQAHLINGFTNAGVLWMHSTGNVSGLLTGTYTYGVVNSGTMMAYSTDGNTYGITAGSGGDYVTNSGRIYAVTQKGNAATIWSFEPGQRVTNSGVIAAQALGEGSAGVGDAVAISLFNGGQIVNQVGGSILGEGIYGRAILMGRATYGGEAQIINHGLIAAATIGSAHQAVAIDFSYLGGSAARIDNDGTIRAQIAIQSTELNFNPFTRGGLEVRNLTGGVIEGALDLRVGDDRIVNNGTITGNVSTGNGRDVFDTSAGTWTGTADMGWEADSFIGSAGGDVVKGGRGGDDLSGNGGNDLLLGGTGDDTITGGAGNDGLYGESGKDRIVTQGGDAAFGGDGDDVIRAGDLSFARIDGGAGNDTLELAAAGIRLDLAAALATGRLTGIETIALGTDQQIKIRAGDATALAGASGKLAITGVAGDGVLLVGSWVAGGTVTRDGQQFRSYTLGGETILIATAVELVDPIASFTGLSAIAAGSAAPVAGSVTGGELMNAVQTGIVVTELYGSVTVDADETWSNTDQSFVYGYNSAEFINRGTLLATANPGNAFIAIRGNDFGSVVNTGTIRVTGVGTAYVSGISTTSTTVLNNSGLIEAIADLGQATAVRASKGGSDTIPVFTNSGVINARSNAEAAVAVRVEGSFPIDMGVAVGTNSGTISATGGAGTIGVQMFVGGRFLNTGGITASNTAGSGATDAVGITLYTNGFYFPATLENRGSITGPTAVKGTGGAALVVNYGTLTGAVSLFNDADFVRNTGTITGPITLGGGRDYYDGSGALRAVTVSGGEGEDTLIGRSGDTLGGGAGKDLFRFASPGTGTITDFLSGTDTLDLSGLAPTSVTLTAGGGSTIVTATSAAGTLVLDVQGTIALSDILTAPRAGTAGDDTLIGGPGAAVLSGLGGNDLLVGTGFNDQLDGGTGSDLMVGGLGDDIYTVDSSGDVVREFDGEGYDTIVIAPGAASLYVRMANNVEQLIGGSGAGNVLDNVMIGSDGADTLNSYDAGQDRLYGGLGDDKYYVAGRDDVVFENAGGGTDTVISDSSFYLYASIENLEIGGQDGSFGVGNELDNKITGSAYANLLLGGAGNDEVHGAAGNDVIYGEAGNDTLFGEYNIDYIDGGAGNDTIDGGYGADALYGGDGDDILIDGDDFATDILVGGAGNDILGGDSGLGDYDLMDGGSGDDSYYVDTGDDLTFEAAGGGTDTVYANVAGANNGVYLYANVENLVLLGTTKFGVGNELANVMTGSASGNWLLGGAGNDTINGKSGNDVLFGEGGADRFVFERGTGGDVIGDFAVGVDKIDLSAFGFADFQAVRNSMHQNGGTTAIDLGNGDFVVVNGVAISAFGAADFILAQGSSAKGDLSTAGAASWDDPVILADLRGDDYARLDISHVEMWHGAPDWVPFLL